MKAIIVSGIVLAICLAGTGIAELETNPRVEDLKTFLAASSFEHLVLTRSCSVSVSNEPLLDGPQKWRLTGTVSNDCELNAITYQFLKNGLFDLVLLQVTVHADRGRAASSLASEELPTVAGGINAETVQQSVMRHFSRVGTSEYVFTVSSHLLQAGEGYDPHSAAELPIALSTVIAAGRTVLQELLNERKVEGWYLTEVGLRRLVGTDLWYYILVFKPKNERTVMDLYTEQLVVPVLINGTVIQPDKNAPTSDVQRTSASGLRMRPADPNVTSRGNGVTHPRAGVER